MSKKFGPKEITVRGMKNYERGVNFEDAPILVEAIDGAYHELSQIYAAKRILIDVTGGHKITTVAGAAVSLAEGRLFQYVSTLDKQVAIFNVTYRLDTD